MRCAKELQAVMLAVIFGLIFYAGGGFAALPETAPGEEPAEVEEEVPPAVVEEEAPPEETLGPGEAMPTVEITPAGMVSFDFRDAAIQDVLRLFARQVNVNIVTTPSVTGMVTMKLDNVNWRKALELILQVNKLKMVEDKENNIIKVMTEAEVATEPMTTKIYSLNYLQAADYDVETIDYDKDGKKVKTTKTLDGAAKLLTKLLAENETMQPDPFGNKLIVRATPASHELLDTVIKDLDRQVRQVLIEVKFIEASTDAGKNLGIKWDFLREYGVSATDLARGFTKTVGKSYGSRSSLLAGEEATDQASDSRTDSSEDGLTTDSFLSRDVTGTRTQSAGWDRARDEMSDTIKTATLSAENVTLVLSALLEDTNAKLVSNPRISTVDNKQATIRAVQEWPIPKYTYSADTGTWEIQGFEFKDIGISLRVTPHINEGNFITLDVDPEVSNQAGTLVFGGGAGGTAEIPIIDSRTAATRVVVKSGETLVIGGLVKTEETLRKSGLPLLKDIPLVGSVLFGHTSKILKNLDLMIFITPTVVEGPGASVLAPPPEYTEGTSAEVKTEEAATSPAVE
jgi:type IV pilus assembly protein PilQ